MYHQIIPHEITNNITHTIVSVLTNMAMTCVSMYVFNTKTDSFFIKKTSAHARDLVLFFLQHTPHS
jgi:hypothetical protein